MKSNHDKGGTAKKEGQDLAESCSQQASAEMCGAYAVISHTE